MFDTQSICDVSAVERSQSLEDDVAETSAATQSESEVTGIPNESAAINCSTTSTLTLQRVTRSQSKKLGAHSDSASKLTSERVVQNLATQNSSTGDGRKNSQKQTKNKQSEKCSAHTDGAFRHFARDNCRTTRSQSALQSKENVSDDLPVWSGKSCYWQEILEKMSKLASYDALIDFIGDLTLPPLADQFSGKIIKGIDFVDRVSAKVGRDEIPPSFLPLQMGKDGNCFCRAISKFCFNRESEHGQVRVRLLVDAIKNEASYLTNKFLRIGAQDGCESFDLAQRYCMYSGHFEGDIDELTDREALEIYRSDWFCFRKLGCFAGIFQIHSAANCFKTKLISHYPIKLLESVYKDLNRSMYPLGCGSTENLRELHILWTSTSVHGRLNHFVPLFRKTSVSNSNPHFCFTGFESCVKPMLMSVFFFFPVRSRRRQNR